MIIDSFVLFFTHARQQKKEAQAEHLPTAIIRAKSKNTEVTTRCQKMI